MLQDDQLEKEVEGKREEGEEFKRVRLAEKDDVASFKRNIIE